MKPFVFERLHSLESRGNQGKDFQFIAGGTNLIDLMKHQIMTPDTLTDISPLDQLKDISETDNVFRIGALVTNTALADYAYKKRELHLLSHALLSGATVQLRNRATTGGNLLQRTRCPYFYDTSKACNKRVPGSGCDALDGHNRYHAVLGTSEHCIAAHPSDMAVAMVALDAKIVTQCEDGQSRTIPVTELYVAPDVTPHIETVLKKGEMITEVQIEDRSRGSHAYRKVRERASYAFALVSVAATLRIENGNITEINLALGGVAPYPWKAEKACQALRGQPYSQDAVRQAMEAEFAPAITRGGNDYKVPLAIRTAVQVIDELAAHQQRQPGHEGAIHVS